VVGLIAAYSKKEIKTVEKTHGEFSKMQTFKTINIILQILSFTMPIFKLLLVFSAQRQVLSH